MDGWGGGKERGGEKEEREEGRQETSGEKEEREELKY